MQFTLLKTKTYMRKNRRFPVNPTGFRLSKLTGVPYAIPVLSTMHLIQLPGP